MSGRSFWPAPGSPIVLEGFQNSWFVNLKVKPLKITKNLTLGPKVLQNMSKNNLKKWPGTYLFLNVRNLDFVSLHGFCMIFTLPWVQESIENRKEIAPANPMPKKSENLSTLSEKHRNWKYDSTACCPPKITIFRPGSFPAPFWSPNRFGSIWRPNDVQMGFKSSPNGSQTTQNGTRIKI